MIYDPKENLSDYLSELAGLCHTIADAALWQQSQHGLPAHLSMAIEAVALGIEEARKVVDSPPADA